MLHSNVVVGDNHYIQQWSVADNTARDALSVSATDVGKVVQVTGTATFYILTDDSPMTWQEIGSGGGSGDVVGPASATDNAIVRFDSTTGKLIQDSGITIADGASGALSGTNSGDQNLFSTIAVSGQSNVVADTTSDTLTLVAGTNVTITTDAATDSITINASGGGGSGITLGTPVASTTGTSIDFTGIPSGTKSITIMFEGVSISGSASYLFQLGDSGGIEGTGYVSIGSTLYSAVNTVTNTSGFILAAGAAGRSYRGAITFSLENSSNNTWVGEGMFGDTTVPSIEITTGSKSLSAELDRVRITTTNGTDTFDAGEINIQYQS